ncbi:Alpha/Beta hydrolase protein [Cladorrhinum samala]|uniref:Alpha/Beta hydrolase protein n=1 Tax=Cladorrhinum samala TaxID=585594 RepID=A0AAV9HY40_9PEZI|nr:Alpha/Beta hydrolase protein [Cladorrhinum samala]
MDTFIPAPGQERPYPPPTRTGTVAFRIPASISPARELSETFYAIWGNLSHKKIPLICLHGGPGIPHDYLGPISLICSDYGIPVIMYDQVGCGRSTHFPEKAEDASFWTPKLFAAELDYLIRSLGITTYDLLGHSWGGMLAAEFALTQPPDLRKLILCDSPADMRTYARVTEELRAMLPAEVQDALASGRHEEESPEYQAAVMQFHKMHLCRVEHGFPLELVKSFAGLAEDNTAYVAMNGPSELHVTGALRDWSVVGELARITERTVPGGVLLINGHFDEAQDACLLPYFIRVGAKVKWVQFALSSHMPHLEETEKFVRTVGAFLSTHN